MSMLKKAGIFITVLLLFAGGKDSFGQNAKIVSMEKFVSKCLYNFSWYVNWPEENRNGDFIFGIVGNKSVYDELVVASQNKKVGLQNIQVVYFDKAENINQYCHVIYLSSWHCTKMDEIKTKLPQKSVLFVTEREGMIHQGSAINFIPEDGMMKFEVSKSNAETCGLQVSSRLENMAVQTN